MSLNGRLAIDLTQARQARGEVAARGELGQHAQMSAGLDGALPSREVQGARDADGDLIRLPVTSPGRGETRGEAHRLAACEPEAMTRVVGACRRLPRVTHREAHPPAAEVGDLKGGVGGLGEAHGAGSRAPHSHLRRARREPRIDRGEREDAQHPHPRERAAGGPHRRHRSQRRQQRRPPRDVHA
ncbi:hypothetical protein [Demequina litorisediminis]|uniref:hypothetical protein n=1 Tax=Demequina litorisediminis TaxID=1849022 RepID=UPI0032AFEC8F